jgi:acetyl esterase/lipase
VKTKAAADPMVAEDMLTRMAEAYAGSDKGHPTASPLFADLAGLPPVLLQVGTAEILLDDATRFADRAEAAGVDVELEVWNEMVHVWHAFADILPEGRQAIERIGAWLRRTLA